MVSETQNSTASEVKVTEGENAGKWYKQLTKEATAEGSGVLTVSATAEAGLEANTQYIVSLAVDIDGAWPGFYSENNNILAYGDQFYRTANTPELVFYVTTDENGEFTRQWKNVYWKGGTYVKFTGLTVLKAAYASGVQGKAPTRMVKPKAPFVNCTEVKWFTQEGAMDYTTPSSMFNGWTGLKSFDFGNLKKIGDNSFENCGFEELVIPSTITHLYSRTFAKNESLKSTDDNSQKS